MRMISCADQENLVKLFHSSEPSVAEMICNNLESLKVFYKLHMVLVGIFVLFIKVANIFLEHR
jgi:hypothetical protein